MENNLMRSDYIIGGLFRRKPPKEAVRHEQYINSIRYHQWIERRFRAEFPRQSPAPPLCRVITHVVKWWR